MGEMQSLLRGARIDPQAIYCDSTIALPIVTAYALANHAPRKPRRLYDRREELTRALAREYREAQVSGPDGGPRSRP